MSYQGPETDIPDDIDDVSEEICKQVLRDSVTSKAYKVIPQELYFYKK